MKVDLIRELIVTPILFRTEAQLQAALVAIFREAFGDENVQEQVEVEVDGKKLFADIRLGTLAVELKAEPATYSHWRQIQTYVEHGPFTGGVLMAPRNSFKSNQICAKGSQFQESRLIEFVKVPRKFV